MKITRYTTEFGPLKRYVELLKLLYADDQRLEKHIETIRSQFAESNPFFNNGTATHFLAEKNQTAVGHVSAITDSRNPGVGLLGFYDCIDDVSTSKALLETAINELRNQNCSTVYGPVNMTIWNNYRFITYLKREAELFDPFSQDYYPTFWEQSGFVVSDTYLSAYRTNFDSVIHPTQTAHDTLKSKGYRIRSFDVANKTKDLMILLGLANTIFQTSWNFVPLQPEEFVQLYGNALQTTNPKYVQIVEQDNGTAIGFCFGTPNPLTPHQYILKTIGVLPSERRHGIGAALLHAQHKMAQQDGFEEIYYALIRDDNVITKLPYPEEQIVTRYATYQLTS